MDDEKIIELYFSRSEEAVSQTAKKYSGRCGRVAYNILHSREDSEECVNDTWLKAWENIPPTRPNRLGAFLMRITRNLSVSRLRKRGGDSLSVCFDELEECIPAGNGDPSDDIAVTDALDRFLNGLNPETRRIFVQKYWYVRPSKDIARELSMSEAAVKMRLSRTRAELKDFLEKEGIFI